MVYSDIVATIAMIIAVIAVPASGFVSYRYAIKGERRKEFNAIADVIRSKVRNQIRTLEYEIYPLGSGDNIMQAEIDQLHDCTDALGKHRLTEVWDRYQETVAQHCRLDAYGDPIGKDFTALRKPLEELMRLCQRK
ncbi:hypothetical protein [Kosakonia radicincitans]|uniref:hypothetical protein n=1 Tax=Kosakonia radicincitans TaxID=283686 RepID=UPI0005C32489|nr:hypothetical protein [Kosakonia radicincitans]KIS42740.1 hypothetical protein LG58_2609 [Kosakonia radicincitans YD4]